MRDRPPDRPRRRAGRGAGGSRRARGGAGAPRQFDRSASRRARCAGSSPASATDPEIPGGPARARRPAGEPQGGPRPRDGEGSWPPLSLRPDGSTRSAPKRSRARRATARSPRSRPTASRRSAPSSCGRCASAGALTMALILRSLLEGERDLASAAFAELSGQTLRAGLGLRPRSLRTGFRGARAGVAVFRVMRCRPSARRFAAIEVHGAGRRGGLKPRLVEATIAACEAERDPALAPILSLLWRFAAEAARAEATGDRRASGRPAPRSAVEARLCARQRRSASSLDAVSAIPIRAIPRADRRVSDRRSLRMRRPRVSKLPLTHASWRLTPQ